MHTISLLGTGRAPRLLHAMFNSALSRVGQALRPSTGHGSLDHLDDKVLADIGLTRAAFYADTLALPLPGTVH